MTCGTPKRGGDKLPILVEVDNLMDKGILPENFLTTYKNDIDYFPTIMTSGARVFHFRFFQEKERLEFSNGWNYFILECNLADKPKVMLKFHGKSFFTFHEENQFVQPHVKTETEDLSPVSDSEPVMGRITLTPYSVSENHQNLPTSFVRSCLNLRLKHVTLDLEGGRSWRFGLYNTDSRPNQARISTGWKDFCSALGLKPGDKIAFKHINGFKNHLFGIIERC